MIRALLCITCTILFFTGCAGTKICLSPEYRLMSADSARLGVVLVKERIEIRNPYDLSRCLGDGNSQEVFEGFWKEFFAPKLAGKCLFKDVIMVNEWNKGDLKEEIKTLGDEGGFAIGVPSAKTFVDDSLEFVLIINGMILSSESVAVYPGSSGKGLAATVHFTLWDNREDKIAAYGKIISQAGEGMIINKNTWFELLTGIADEFSKQMPYGRTL